MRKKLVLAFVLVLVLGAALYGAWLRRSERKLAKKLGRDVVDRIENTTHVECLWGDYQHATALPGSNAPASQSGWSRKEGPVLSEDEWMKWKRLLLSEETYHFDSVVPHACESKLTLRFHTGAESEPPVSLIICTGCLGFYWSGGNNARGRMDPVETEFKTLCKALRERRRKQAAETTGGLEGARAAGASSEQSIEKGEHALVAHADVMMDREKATLTIKNTLEIPIFVPEMYESKNIKVSTSRLIGCCHADGLSYTSLAGHVILEPGKTREYHFDLEDPFDKDAKYEFSIWAPIRDRENLQSIIDKENVVYRVEGKYPRASRQASDADKLRR